MFLKTIEIRGFKSFADKTELSFKNGVTAVVGPNGSGKSNISDAVRWVLGEQSIKTLRGGKMEDVIFAGTQYRKPVGLAQVALTLDNSDYELPLEYSDVTISRRLYRSGDSEYYINNTLCRLKDIHELFMDTGIGKEGYSIIGQGKIEAILSGRPEDRRNLLEEAAGIVKFKTRKEEAEKKLDNTDQNLVRINDILSTYEERLEPLRIENEKAKAFIELSEQLKTKEVTLILHSIDKIQGKLNQQTGDILRLQEEILKFNEERNSCKNEMATWNDALENHEQQSSDDKNRYYELKNRNQNTISEINLLNERINNLLSTINRATSAFKELQSNIEVLHANKGTMEAELKLCQKEQGEFNSAITGMEKEVEILGRKIIQEQNNSILYREDEIEFLRKISDARNKSAVIENNIDSSQKKLEQINIACESYNNSIKINTSTKAALELEIERIQQAIAVNENEIKSIKREMTQLGSRLSSEEQSLRQFTNESNRLEANHNMLVNLEKQYEGYNKAVKNLMQHIENGKIPEAVNKCFVFGNIIKVENKLELAMEVALGGAISDIVTYEESTAKGLIKYLKDNNLGRATFLPLNILTSKTLNIDSRIAGIVGFVGVANKLVQFDPVFKNAVDYVLGRTVIATNLDSALLIAKQSNYSYRIVTLTGEVVNPGGSLTGGSMYHKGANIIGRKREIEDIERKSKEVKEEIRKVAERIENTRQVLKELDTLGLNLRDDIHYKQIEVTKIEGKITAIVSDSEKLKQNMKTSNDEVGIIHNKIEGYRAELTKGEEEIKVLTEKEKENQIAIEQSEEMLKACELHMQELKDRLLEKKIKKAQVDESVLSKIKELERVARDLENSLLKSEEYQTEVTESETSLNISKEAVEQKQSDILQLADSIQAIEAKFEANEIRRIELKDIIRKLSGRHEELSLLIQKKEEEKHRWELILTKQESEKDALYTRLNEEMGLTYAEALKFKGDMPDIDKFKSEISTLKSKITVLGVVNLGAIEEYEQIKEKYSFMSTQRDDLIRAKNELINVINEMTSKMKEVFNENFQKLRENFNETFRELFKGGSADLILAEGDELTANIEINVQPPGKKLQNINLMSGGEKGLSAIALLFAILKMKPTPFCILDEIEAALDDANVFRYAEFLKKFSERIQFIVITHRKGTMEASDVLYGVTMEEKGVSKIVSMDLGRQ